MGDIDIYLAGEEHESHEYMLAGMKLIKRLADSGSITCFSMELPFEKYQICMDNFKIDSYGDEFGIYTPWIFMSKKRGLDVIASDYRDTFAGQVINAIRELDGSIDEPDEIKEKLIADRFRPLTYVADASTDKPDVYRAFSKELQKAEDIFDFLAAVYTEERERFTANRLDEYLLRNQPSSILHICGLDHLEGLVEKLGKKGRKIEVIDLMIE